MGQAYGIDISSYQGLPNYSVLNSQVDFAAIRAGISWGFVDPRFKINWQNVAVPKIAYHVVYPGENANRQMEHFLSIEPLKPTDRLALDLELAHGYSKRHITDTVLQCLYYLRENTGRYPVIYSRANWVDEYLYVDQLPTDLDWWLATYLKRLPSPFFTPERSSPPLMPKGVTRWLIHQTGERSKGSKVGVQSYYVDSDRWNGTLETMNEWFSREEELPIPPVVEKPLYKAVVIDIDPDGLRVRSTPNGTVVDKVYTGTELEIWQEVTDWVRIGVNRWVMEKFIQRIPDEAQIIDGLLDIPLWNQRDPNWGSLLMGNSGITLAEQGCLVSDTAACLSLILGREMTPLEYGTLLNSGPNKSYGYLSPTNRMYWQIPKVKYGIPLEIYKAFPSGYGWEDTVRAQLKKGLPSIARVDMLPGAGYLQHWVNILGEIEGIFWIHDPWYGTTSALRARYDKVYHISSYGWRI